MTRADGARPALHRRWRVRPRASAAASIALALLAWLSPPVARAADPFYIGTWKIASAAVAPWWQESTPPDPAERGSLVGRTFALLGDRITGPRQTACRHPHYVLKDYPADMLFQGMFGEMQSRDAKVDPLAVAHAAGFSGASWKTLETGCETELDFHFLDERHAAFALNNYLYFLTKQ